MDISRFEQMARAPGRTREELEAMKMNALAKGHIDLARIAEDVLRERFPARRKKSGAATPTRVRFRGRTETFPTGKDAYLWLIDQFRLHRSTIFDDYTALHQRAASAGRRFARTPDGLFPSGSTRAGNPVYYTKVEAGWYADINLNHNDKFSTLLQLAYLAGLEYPADWTFEVEGGTTELLEHQKAVIKAEELLNELLSK
jgi:hypothetical protein